ncbi:MAG: hypothetical protein JJU13_21500 [Balneolaceae bacterium]|nr:hypothetical protein [Balneolaceae bacterium]
MSISVFGPLEFFFTATTRDMVAECYGERTVGQFFNDLAGKRILEKPQKTENRLCCFEFNLCTEFARKWLELN